jgi:hypothetical protein
VPLFLNGTSPLTAAYRIARLGVGSGYVQKRLWGVCPPGPVGDFNYAWLLLALPAIFFWIAWTLRSVEVASASISLTTRCGVLARPRCLPRASAALIPASRAR